MSEGEHKSSGKRAKREKRPPTRRRMSKAKSAQGMHLYVTGECGTFREVAEVLKVSDQSVGITAAAQEWTRRRAEYIDEQAHRRIQETQRRQIKAVLRCQGFAWAATQSALKSLARRLDRGELVPRPSEVESIARTALALTGAQVDDGIERDELEKMTLPEILARTARQIEAGIGGEL